MTNEQYIKYIQDRVEPMAHEVSLICAADTRWGSCHDQNLAHAIRYQKGTMSHVCDNLGISIIPSHFEHYIIIPTSQFKRVLEVKVPEGLKEQKKYLVGCMGTNIKKILSTINDREKFFPDENVPIFDKELDLTSLNVVRINLI